MNNRTPFGPLNPNNSQYVAELIRVVNSMLENPELENSREFIRDIETRLAHGVEQMKTPNENPARTA